MVKNILVISSLDKLCNANFIFLENQGLRWWVKPLDKALCPRD